ncbi:ferritin light chain-like [Bos indicus x Bos taurus]|uniref:ferritin light chain-like n=1 Tax=Bos indicus x Bos taurus TaxID=30522 RepID=UPI000F7D1FC5|nr:ferritin light chain-like [Bos indicus x Bos taurus]
MSSQTHQNDATQVEAAVNCPVNMYLHASYTHLSGLISTTMALECMGHLLKEFETGWKLVPGALCCSASTWTNLPSSGAMKYKETEQGKTQDAVEAIELREKHPKSAFMDLQARGSASAIPTFSTSLTAGRPPGVRASA